MTRNDDTADGDGTGTESGGGGALDALANPESLRDRDDVACAERDRVLPPEKFDALRERYEQIAGVTQFGVTDDDGAVLLAGDESYAPPGGNVLADDDWVATTERTATDLFGVDVRVDRAAMFERTVFCREDDEDESFGADSVLFEASVDDADAESFHETPTFADGLDHPLYGDGSETDLAWFDAITEDVHENHVHHVELFLD